MNPGVRIQLLFVAVVLASTALVVGCDREAPPAATAPAAAAPAPIAASLNETVTAGERAYRLGTESMEGQETELLIAILELWDFGDPPMDPEDLVVSAYGSDGRKLERPSGWGVGLAGTIQTPTPAELAKLSPGHARIWGDIPYQYEIRKGETSITVELEAPGQPTVRWRVR